MQPRPCGVTPSLARQCSARIPSARALRATLERPTRRRARHCRCTSQHLRAHFGSGPQRMRGGERAHTWPLAYVHCCAAQQGNSCAHAWLGPSAHIFGSGLRCN
eukprot:2078117-Alexandrium_andersonii.AAC.1